MTIRIAETRTVGDLTVLISQFQSMTYRRDQWGEHFDLCVKVMVYKGYTPEYQRDSFWMNYTEGDPIPELLAEEYIIAKVEWDPNARNRIGGMGAFRSIRPTDEEIEAVVERVLAKASKLI